MLSVSFSPGGTMLASGSRNTINIWDVVTGACKETLRGHTDRVWSLSFSRVGKWLASGSQDHTTKIWKFETFIDKSRANVLESNISNSNIEKLKTFYLLLED